MRHHSAIGARDVARSLRLGVPEPQHDTTVGRHPLAFMPNLLTCARLGLVPVVAVLVAEDSGAASLTAALLYIAAAVTDQVDGFLARRWNARSAFGALADPLADKLMIVGVGCVLAAYGRLPWAGLGLLAARQVLLMTIRLSSPRGTTFRVSQLGRLSAWLLYVALGAAMLLEPTNDVARIALWLGVASAWGEIPVCLAARHPRRSPLTVRRGMG